MKKKKIILRIFIILILILSAPFIFRLSFVLKEKGKILTKEELISERTDTDQSLKAADAIIVLGCGVYPDGTLSPLLRYRMERAMEVYKAGLAKYIYVTGDHREGEYDEVDHMREWLLDRGVDETYILCDYDGYSTFESMEHAKEAPYWYVENGERKKRPLQDVIVVTQKYHLYRALYIGEKMGLSVKGCAAEDWPMSAGTLIRHLREIPACIKDWIQFQGIRSRI